jgi:hypothetical protein
MIQKISTPVTVTLVFNHKRRVAFPREVLWEGKEYPILKIGLHHSYRAGRTLYHVFSAASKEMFFRLVLNTDNLFWTLEEISDGMAD